MSDPVREPSALRLLSRIPGAVWHFARRGRLIHALTVALRILTKRGFRGMIKEMSLHLDHDLYYASWIVRHDVLSDTDRLRLADYLEHLPRKPLISLLMPVFNSHERWLRDAVMSVRSQIYSNWQLCIVDDASTAPHVRPLLESLARSDERIQVSFQGNNGHIARASNVALAMAKGEYFGLVDHDDLLAPHALALVAIENNEHPDADLIYSDEDKIDLNGRRFGAYFKPDWNPDLARSQNMISHFGIYRTALARQAGGFRPGYEGSQDWDLALRVIDLSSAERIRHVPYVLYHWRTVPGSTATGVEAKSYAIEAGRKAVADHLARHNMDARLATLPHGHLEVQYVPPAKPPSASLVVSVNDRLDIQAVTRHLPEWLALAGMLVAEVIVAGTVDDLVELRETRLQVPVPIRYIQSGRGVALQLRDGAKCATGDILVFLSPQLRALSDGWLLELVTYSLRPDTGAVGARLLSHGNGRTMGGYVLGMTDQDGQDAPRVLVMNDLDCLSGRTQFQQNLSAISMDCLVVRREIYTDMEGLRVQLFPERWADIDFCLRLRSRGLWNVWIPRVRFEFATEHTIVDVTQMENDALLAHWFDWFNADPAYNPNLGFAWSSPMPDRPRHVAPWRTGRQLEIPLRLE